MKKVLALVGDYYHPSDYLKQALKMVIKNDYQLDIFSSHQEINWEGLLEYDILILATWGKINDPDDEAYWLDEYHEKKIDQFLAEGGKLFLVHSGTASYPKDGLFREIAGGHFIQHPEEHPEITIKAAADNFLTRGITDFKITDEQYFMDVDPEVEVFLKAESDQFGESTAGWTKDYKKGKVIVLTPGHTLEVFEEEMMQKLINNILEV
ncbi:trehalose utilization protein [Halanaerobium saccharolyticum]|uniref:Trehalose utilization protein n=1 Tax=Halanaerobium saccharolyticum TaxID=43595 RepID=A0A4R7Z130_9FIRM|nr:ThuA domain-containing protein [Halanaerobium saccharolyticum]RAK08121.1 trehalose utilization protein [Halanaerobium saccharolyticum]TDW04328.1 trehalose utilization protein [Halanaerobium saccharolyticum]TDX59619.1 trehalose utilization protein [Halanaerobium saccharolyticum]